MTLLMVFCKQERGIHGERLDVSDFTQERVYMSTIIDAYTKEILSWVLSDSLILDFVLDTVTQLRSEERR